MSALAWIDFDQTDRDRARRIMDLFGIAEARDELGLGSIRDALSDLMFPGTSTIQTRLRYMLFVPWLYRMTARSGGQTEHARRLEILLITALLRGGEPVRLIRLIEAVEKKVAQQSVLEARQPAPAPPMAQTRSWAGNVAKDDVPPEPPGALEEGSDEDLLDTLEQDDNDDMSP